MRSITPSPLKPQQCRWGSVTPFCGVAPLVACGLMLWSCAPVLGSHKHPPKKQDKPLQSSEALEPLVFKDRDFTLDDNLLRVGELEKREVVVENDPVFQKPKGYLAFDLRQLLQAKIENFEAKLHEGTLDLGITFVNRDRQRLTRRLKNLLKEGVSTFLAFQETAAENSLPWSLIPGSRAPVTLGPYYLMIESTTNGNSSWEFFPRIVKIIVTDLKKSFAGAYPTPTPQQPTAETVSAEAERLRGFEVFLQNCSVCHSINLKGTRERSDLIQPKHVILPDSTVESFRELIMPPSPEAPAEEATATPLPEHLKFAAKLSEEDTAALFKYLQTTQPVDLSQQKPCEKQGNCPPPPE